MADYLSALIPEGVDSLDERAARRAAVECINAAGQVLRAAMRPAGAITKENILRYLYDLDRAWINASMYHATAGTLIFGDGPCHRAYERVEMVRAEIAQAVASLKANPDAPSDGWSTLWDLYSEHFGGADVLWNSYQCGWPPSASTGDSVVDWIQDHIRHAALASPWHFGAWRNVCDRLKQFSQEELLDLVGVLLNLPEPATEHASQQVEPTAVPPMWEGGRPDFPIKSLADVLKWLDAMSVNLPIMRNYPLAFKQGAALDLARQILRNTRRLLDQLGESAFPQHRDSELSSIHEAEAAIAELRRWISGSADQRLQLNDPSAGEILLGVSNAAVALPNRGLPAETVPDAPADLSAYVPAKDVIARCGETFVVLNYKRLSKILEENPDIKRHKPSKNRLLVHLADFEKFARRQRAGDDSFEQLDEYCEGVESRKNAIRQKKEQQGEIRTRRK